MDWVTFGFGLMLTVLCGWLAVILETKWERSIMVVMAAFMAGAMWMPIILACRTLPPVP